MPKKDLENAIQQATSEFAQAVIRAIKESSLQELLSLQEQSAVAKAPAKPGREKKAARKPGRKKPGRPPKTVKKPVKKAAAPKKTVKKVAAPKKTQARKRISGDEKKALLDSIVAFLEKNPASKGPAVAAAMRLEMERARAYLKDLRDAGLVTTQGEKTKMVYSAVAGG